MLTDFEEWNKPMQTKDRILPNFLLSSLGYYTVKQTLS